MLQIVIPWILFLLPGVAADRYYLYLCEGSNKGSINTIVRILSFNILILTIRGMVSISRGYSNVPVQEIFSGIGNVTKYVLLASVLIILLPNIYVVIPELLQKYKNRTTFQKKIEGREEKNEQK